MSYFLTVFHISFSGTLKPSRNQCRVFLLQNIPTRTHLQQTESSPDHYEKLPQTYFPVLQLSTSL